MYFFVKIVTLFNLFNPIIPLTWYLTSKLMVFVNDIGLQEREGESVFLCVN